MIGIICPSSFEYDILNQKPLASYEYEIIVSGMGKVRALYACSRLKAKHPSLKALLLIGFAGGLTPSLNIGDVVEPGILIEQDYNAEPFEVFPNSILSPYPQLLSYSSRATILTQDRFLTENPYRYSAYSEKYQRLACDMESYAVAYYATQENIPFFTIKWISDTANHTASHDFLANCQSLAPRLNQSLQEALQVLQESCFEKDITHAH